MTLSELFASIVAQLGAHLAAMLVSPTQLAANLAALAGIALVVAGAFARTILPLRWLAVGSNLGLLVYGLLHPSLITLLVTLSLLPINLYRAVEVTRLTQRVTRAAAEANEAALWLRPYMKMRRLKAGQTLFSKGDRADRLYLLADGRLEAPEIGLVMQAGRIFGEIALFSPLRQRTRTLRCISDCTVLEIHESTVRQLFFQNPAFAFHLVELLAKRLGDDVERAQAAAAAGVPPTPSPASGRGQG